MRTYHVLLRALPFFMQALHGPVMEGNSMAASNSYGDLCYYITHTVHTDIHTVVLKDLIR